MTGQRGDVRTILTAALALAVCATGAVLSAQDPAPAPLPPQAAPVFVGTGRATNGWTTVRGDSQRTASVRNDAELSAKSLQKPGFELQWTASIGQASGETLGEGASGNVSGNNPAPGDIAGSANNVYGYEIDTGAVAWTRHLDVATPRVAPTAACPGGLTAGVTRPTALSGGVTGVAANRTGSSTPASRGALGAPGEGVPSDALVERNRGRGAAPAAPGRGGGNAANANGDSNAPAARGRGAAPQPAPARGGAARGGGGTAAPALPPSVYTVTIDGMLRTIGQQQGKEVAKPTPFVPPNAYVSTLVAVNDVVYATTINGCGNAPNGAWALNLGRDGSVSSWKSGASPVGAPAFATDGTMFLAIGNGAASADAYADAIVALSPGTLAVKDWFVMPGASFSTGPMVFPGSGRTLVAAATRDGRVVLLDAASLGGSDHKTPLAVTPATNRSRTWSPSALATWQDDGGTRWLLVPGMAGAGNVTTFKVNGSSLDPGWTSTSALMTPSAPIVVDDIVFVLNEGSATAPGVLYALDGASGKELWTSGRAITAAVHAPIWSSSGQVYVAAADRTVYAFGFAQDRHP